jgi:hypothetical protein
MTALAGMGGGSFLTALSGLYAVKPLLMDAEMIYFGFPFAWYEAGRKGLLVIGPWVYRFVWQNFAADFVMYGLLASGVAYLCFSRRRRFAVDNLKTKSGTTILGQ